MPPGARPPGAAPLESSHTQAAATGGSEGLRASLDARAQAASYGTTGQAQALRDLAGQIGSGQQGYSSHPGNTDAYAQWQQNQGFRPQGYGQVYGQTDKGKYSGYKTEADMWGAVTGRAELAREQDLAQAAAMKDSMSQRYAALGQTVDTNMTGAGAALRDSRNRLPVGSLPGASDQLGKAVTDYHGQLNNWYANQGAPLVQGMETANQIQGTPTREYEMRSGAALGIAPELIAGKFPMSTQIQDASNQRDLQSLSDTGLPYSEQQSTLHGVQTDARQAQADQVTQTRQQAADQQQQMDDAVYGATTHTGKDVSSATGVPLQDVYDITTSPGFQTYADNVQAAVQAAQDANPAYGTKGAAGDAAANKVADALDQAINDAVGQVMTDTKDQNTAQVTERILRTLYGNI